jgi:hypothetical protein
MTVADVDREALALLEQRLNALLPEEYRGADAEPTQMGSAGLRFDSDGRVAWDEMWKSFCDLAMAGGPPHKGRLLQPGSRVDIDAAPERYAEAVQEICRGLELAADLQATAAPDPGWVRVRCFTDAMAGWLLRAITMENVAVRGGTRTIDLPAGPNYRLEKEIKNVITVTAKTCHYWVGHIPRTQQTEIDRLFGMIAAETPLIGPADSAATPDAAYAPLATAILQRTELRTAGHHYGGWLGIEIPNVRAAIWMMRALVVNNVLARREGTVLFVPVHPSEDPGGEQVARRLARVWQLARARNLLS